jgi:NDP-4-keto-2,6-dideoxyhexose 3-C-methyltransferase
MGASTKGNTLLQYFDIDNSLIEFAAEVNEDKFGKKTVGTNIPIINEKLALEMNPDYFIVLPWHFIDMLLKVHRPYLNNGGMIMVPMPEPAVYYVDSSGELIKELL